MAPIKNRFKINRQIEKSLRKATKWICNSNDDCKYWLSTLKNYPCQFTSSYLAYSFLLLLCKAIAQFHRMFFTSKPRRHLSTTKLIYPKTGWEKWRKLLRRKHCMRNDWQCCNRYLLIQLYSTFFHKHFFPNIWWTGI